MQKVSIGLIIIMSMSLFSISAYAEVYLNFDSEIQGFEWDYTRLDQSIAFSVNIRNILDPGNYIVHLEIEPEKNRYFHDDTRLVGVTTGVAKHAFFEYPIETIDELSIKTWINPPTTSAKPGHIFDEKVYKISKEQLWQKIITAIDGILLSYDVTLDENSDLDIKIYHTSTVLEPKGIRVMYSGNAEICDSFTFEVEDKPIGSFSGDGFFDRTVNLGGLENPDFHIICELPDYDEAIVTIPNLQEILKNDLYVTETTQCYNSFCIFGFNNTVGSDDNIVVAIIGVIVAIITLGGIIIKTRNK